MESPFMFKVKGKRIIRTISPETREKVSAPRTISINCEDINNLCNLITEYDELIWVLRKKLAEKEKTLKTVSPWF